MAAELAGRPGAVRSWNYEEILIHRQGWAAAPDTPRPGELD